MRPKAAIFGCSAHSLTSDEKRFFEESNPLGFILFARNCDNKEQVKALVKGMRECVGRNAPVLIDQEGGRVQRLASPNWPKHPAVCSLVSNDVVQSKHNVYKHAQDISCELAELGINVNCAPLIDVPVEECDDIIGDRAFSSDPDVVSEMGRVMCDAFIEHGVLPIIKHIPGHGRAKVDSHKELPIVDASLEELEKADFIPFRKLNDMPVAMTAHIVYEALDEKLPATLSKTVINFIRNEINFDGLLVSDDLSMKALSGTFTEKTRSTIEAGCDVVLHCNGDMMEMSEVAEAVCEMGDEGVRRWKQAETLLLK